MHEVSLLTTFWYFISNQFEIWNYFLQWSRFILNRSLDQYVLAIRYLNENKGYHIHKDCTLLEDSFLSFFAFMSKYFVFLCEFFSRWYNVQDIGKNEIFRTVKISAFFRKVSKYRITLRILQSSPFYFRIFPNFKLKRNSKINVK